MPKEPNINLFSIANQAMKEKVSILKGLSNEQTRSNMRFWFVTLSRSVSFQIKGFLLKINH